MRDDGVPFGTLRDEEHLARRRAAPASRTGRAAVSSSTSKPAGSGSSTSTYSRSRGAVSVRRTSTRSPLTRAVAALRLDLRPRGGAEDLVAGLRRRLLRPRRGATSGVEVEALDAQAVLVGRQVVGGDDGVEAQRPTRSRALAREAERDACGGPRRAPRRRRPRTGGPSASRPARARPSPCGPRRRPASTSIVPAEALGARRRAPTRRPRRRRPPSPSSSPTPPSRGSRAATRAPRSACGVARPRPRSARARRGPSPRGRCRRSSPRAALPARRGRRPRRGARAAGGRTPPRRRRGPRPCAASASHARPGDGEVLAPAAERAGVGLVVEPARARRAPSARARARRRRPARRIFASACGRAADARGRGPATPASRAPARPSSA